MTILRRAIWFAIAISSALALFWLMASTLATGGWTLPKTLILVCFAPAAPWLGICVGNALTGFALLVFARDPPAAAFPVPGDFEHGGITAKTALLVTVRNEDMAVVIPPLQGLLSALSPYGGFVAWVISDTMDPGLAAAEEAAMVDTGLFYRRRSENTGFKAGNVMEFLEHHAAGVDLAIMLDADSVMSPAAVLRLVRMMQAEPHLAIVQHLTVGLPATSAFPRLFQFGMRAGMRVWATGQSWWQGMEGPYWGHNAVLRVDAFRAHGRLSPLPDGSTILSHDQVEAALLCAAGYGVAVWAGEDGSQEANPPALPEFLHRDSRWLAGNLQYRWLLRLPGLRPVGRWQLVQAVLLFAGAPFYTAILALAAWSAAAGDPCGEVAPIAWAWALALYSPKLLGYVEVFVFAARRGAYGGGTRFAGGALAEVGFTLLLDAIAQPNKTLAMLRLALGRRAGWLPQNRTDRGVTWAEAARLFWPHSLFGIAVFAGFAAAGWTAVLWAAPFAIGLPLAIPFCVLTASPSVSAWLRRHAIAAIPEELSRTPD